MHSDRKQPEPTEQEAVRTTIVGGRPPGCGKSVGSVPRGIEVLVKKASVDAEFRALLMARRAEAAREIGLELQPAEAAMLDAIPVEQLVAIIERTHVSPLHRAVFLGTAATLMLAALGATVLGCKEQVADKGVRPEAEGTSVQKQDAPPQPQTKGIRPDFPAPTGSRPDPPAVEKKDDPPAKPPEQTRGIRPDLPEKGEAEKK